MPHDLPSLVLWRRLDVAGLEMLRLKPSPTDLIVQSSVVCADGGGFRLDHAWTLTPDWRACSLRVVRWDLDGRHWLELDRRGDAWWVDGRRRPDLDGCAEPDLSVSPFSNTLAVHRMADGDRAGLTLDAVYVDGDAMTVCRSTQRYVPLAAGRVRYVDLGVHAGFEADLRLDASGLVRHYEGLFERIEAAPRDSPC